MQFKKYIEERIDKDRKSLHVPCCTNKISYDSKLLSRDNFYKMTTKLSIIDVEISKPVDTKILEKFPNLTYLTLCNIEFTSFPKEIFALTKLKLLNLSNNKISEVIPMELSNLSTLKNINLSNNSICGIIHSKVFLKLKKLESLNLSNNKLCGYLDEIIVIALKNLTELILHNNFLSGELRLDKKKVSYKLSLLDIRYNNITGERPKPFNNLEIFADNNKFDNKEDNMDLDSKCPICYQIMNLYLDRETTKCKHTFHSSCFNEWKATLKSKATNLTCPMCRTLL